MQYPPTDSPHEFTHRGRDCGISVPPSRPILPLTHGRGRVPVSPPNLPMMPSSPPFPLSSFQPPPIFSCSFIANFLASVIGPTSSSSPLFPKQFFPSSPFVALSTSYTSTPKRSSPSLFGVPLPSLSPAAASADVTLLYHRSPLPALKPPSPTSWFYHSDPTLPPISTGSAPVLNLNPSSSPLTFKSALSGPFHPQWLLASDTELVKLVEIPPISTRH
jgi:hypothetical protein